MDDLRVKLTALYVEWMATAGVLTDLRYLPARKVWCCRWDFVAGHTDGRGPTLLDALIHAVSMSGEPAPESLARAARAASEAEGVPANPFKPTES
jgi:hypothetical protein